MIKFLRFQFNIKYKIQANYMNKKLVGKGTYGVVANVLDENNQNLAIKKIINPFEHKEYAKRTLRELKILRLVLNIKLDKS